jgi:hypothetical protein
VLPRLRRRSVSPQVAARRRIPPPPLYHPVDSSGSGEKGPGALRGSATVSNVGAFHEPNRLLATGNGDDRNRSGERLRRQAPDTG